MRRAATWAYSVLAVTVLSALVVLSFDYAWVVFLPVPALLALAWPALERLLGRDAAESDTHRLAREEGALD